MFDFLLCAHCYWTECEQHWEHSHSVTIGLLEIFVGCELRICMKLLTLFGTDVLLFIFCLLNSRAEGKKNERNSVVAVALLQVHGLWYFFFLSLVRAPCTRTFSLPKISLYWLSFAFNWTLAWHVHGINFRFSILLNFRWYCLQQVRPVALRIDLMANA